jgi:acetyltransferase-like isoleucine patch superfamily enzyme
MKPFIHPTADVATPKLIGEDTRIWRNVHVREGARVGRECVLGDGVYVGAAVKIGDFVKIQNYVSLFQGVTVEDGVFIGPHVCFTNDILPRAVNPDGSPKSNLDWTLTPTLIKRGASLGANSTIVAGVTVGEWALLGAGSVLTHDLPAYGLAWGSPARLKGFVCPCGNRLEEVSRGDTVLAKCAKCGQQVEIPLGDWNLIDVDPKVG